MNKKIFVAGHNGMVGSAITRALKKRQDIELVTKDRISLNLLSQEDVDIFFKN